MGLAVLAVVSWKLGVDGFFAAQVIALVLIFPLQIWTMRSDFKIQKFSFKWAKKLVVWGYPFIFASLAYVLFGSMDKWMLAVLYSTEEVGVYSIAYRFASIVLFVSAAFGKAWSPIAIKLMTDFPEDYRRIFGNVLIILFFCMWVVGGGVSLFSGELLNVVMPEEYGPSALPLCILSIGIIFQSTQQVTLIGISIENKTFLFARLAWLIALLNLVGNWALIPILGSIGAAISTLISYLLLTCSYLFYTQRLHPIILSWGAIIRLTFLGLLVFGVSILFVAETAGLSEIFIKLLFALICMTLGWFALPNNVLMRDIFEKR